ncbi:hypothetical protein B0H16DRAFT_1454843 [Mycena metata]|uniref:Uncharacterized protein n=1 Tax=Mycena metata TaxID=1033252 RepID=A0AAD7NKK2_9AGAR|nr:hypothetical protein B0H16DRAFT_1454843 [Mycena metata]
MDRGIRAMRKAHGVRAAEYGGDSVEGRDSGRVDEERGRMLRACTAALHSREAEVDAHAHSSCVCRCKRRVHGDSNIISVRRFRTNGSLRESGDEKGDAEGGVGKRMQ